MKCSTRESFGQHLKTIQSAAHELIKLQEVLKKEKTMTDNERDLYTQNIEKISLAAQKLTQIEEEAADLTSIYAGKAF